MFYVIYNFGGYQNKTWIGLYLLNKFSIFYPDFRILPIFYKYEISPSIFMEF